MPGFDLFYTLLRGYVHVYTVYSTRGVYGSHCFRLSSIY